MKANAFRLRIAVVVLAAVFMTAPLRAQCTVTCTATVPSTGAAGVAVDFESTASPCLCSGSPSYFWDFGDGTDSTDATPSHAYASDGTYEWELTVTADAVTCTKSGSITIGPVTPAAGTYSGTTSLGHAFSLTVNGSSQITSWSVAFSGLCGSTGSANGSTCSIANGSFSCGSASCIPFSTQASISGTFSSATSVGGTATLKGMPDTINCCTQTPSFSANLSPGPLTASATPDVSSGNAPLTVNFTGSASGGTGPYSYSWDFGDCSAASSAQNPSHVYPAGNWNAVLTVTDSASATAHAVVPIGATALPGITVDPTSGLTTTEFGWTDTFNIVLDTQPAADVTIDITTADPTEGLVGPDSSTAQSSMMLTFTPADWDTPQTVYVHGQDDNIEDGDITFSIVTAPAESADLDYDGIDPADVSVTNEDVFDHAGVDVTPAHVTVSESGSTDTFSVVLESEPTGDVIIDIASTDTAEATVSPAQLTFTPANYDTPQDVTVTGVDDAVEDGDQLTDIELTMNAATADPVYAGIEPPDVTATTTDDEVMVIVSTNPAPNARAASRSADVQATASAGVNAATVTQATFRVQGDQTGRIAGTYSATGTTMELDPSNDFKPGETIKVTATSGIASTAAVALQPYVWHFTAAAEPAPGLMQPHPTSGFGAGSSWALALGDLDGDGDLDAVVGNEAAQADTVWLNDGSGVFSPHPTAPSFSGPASSLRTAIVLGDLDGDGDLDAVVGNYSNAAETVWLNDGSGAFSAHPTTPVFGTGSTLDVELADLDGDGDLDAIVANDEDQPETVWKNDGAGNFTAYASFNTGDSHGLALGDIDGDGDIDCLVADYGSAITVWENDGAANLSPHSEGSSFGSGKTTAVRLGDFDLDGDLDAVVARYDGESETLWDNTFGDGAFSSNFFTPSLPGGNTQDVVFADVDGDGDLDIITLNYYGEAAAIWTNSSIGSFSAHATFAPGAGSNEIVMGDLDGDGDLDAVVANGPDEQETVWLNRVPLGFTIAPASGLTTTEAGGTATFTVRLQSQPIDDVTIAFSTTDATEGRVSDDGTTQQLSVTLTFTPSNWDTPQTITVHGQDDGVDDGNIAYTIASAGAASTDPDYNGLDPADVAVTNNDDDTASVSVAPAALNVAEGGTATFDVSLGSEPDGSVAIDIVSADTGQVLVSPAQLTFNSSAVQTVTVTGLDDGDLDGDVQTVVTLTMNTAATTDAAYDPIDPADVTVTTLDDEELLIVSTNPESSEKAAPRNANVAATANAAVNTSTVTQSTFRVQGDQTGRIAGAYSTSSATFELNPANDFRPGETIKVTATSSIEGTAGHSLVPRVWQFTAAAGAGTGAMFAHPVAPRFGPDGARDAVIADLDADGLLDVLIASETALETWLGDGSGLFSLSTTLSEHEGGDVPTIAVGDLDGDGDLDAVMAKWLTQGKIFINDGTGTFTTHAFASGGDYSYDLALGDLDGDGDLDVVVTTGGSNQPDKVYLNDGAGVFSPHPVTPAFGASVGKDVALGDLDGDGDLDAVVATEQQGEETWLNDGTGSFSAHPGTPAFGGGEYSEGVALGDLDGDGDLDAVFANATPLPETVWLNDGTGAFSAHPTTPQFGAGFSSDVALGDVDGDGDLDAVVAEYSQEGQSSVWVNDGDGDLVPHPVTPLFDHGQRYGGVVLGDLDGDGDLDAIGVGGFSGSAGQTVWLNAEIGVSPVSGLVTTEGGGTTTFTVTLNRQPSDDVTIPVSTSDGSEGRISTDGATQQTALNLTFTSADWNVARTITVHGQDDAFVDGNIAYTIVAGAATSSDPFFSGVDPADVSASNSDDDAAGVNVSTNAVSVSEHGTAATFTVVLTSQPAGDVAIDVSSSDTGEATVSPAQLTFDSGNWSTPQTVTVTGVADALADGDQNTTISVAMNTGATTDPLYDAIDPADVTATTVDDLVVIVDSAPGANEASAPRTANIAATASHPVNASTVTQSTFRVQGDRTGRIAGAYSGAAETFMLDPAADLKPGETIRVTATAGIESTGGIDVRPHVWQFIAATAASTGAMVPHPSNPAFAAGDLGVALGDLDGDGDLDAIFISNGNYDTTWLNDGTGALTLHASFGNVSASKIGVALGDLDGDGDLDAVVTARFEDETVWLNDGAANFSLHTTFEANWTTRVALGDLDGDGDLDAVMGHEDAGGTTWLNDGSATFTAHPTTPAFGAGGPHDLALGDVDGDGDLDAVMPGYNGLERVWRNDGTGSFSAGPTFGNAPNGDWDNTWTLALGDLDGDGDLDALTANMIDQPERVWLNDGTGTFSAHPTIPLFGAGNSRAVLLGDLDGDGDLDAIVPDAGGGAEPVWMNDGTGGFSAHPSVPALAAGDSWGGALGDLDGDGDLDAVISNAGNPRQDETVWLNERVAFSQTSGIATTEAGGTGTFSVVLGRQPSANVSFELTSSDPTEGRLSTDGTTEQNAVTLTFTASNWSTPQVVTVHGQDDLASDGDTAYTIATGAVASSDPFYSGVNPLDVSATSSDDDAAGVTLSTNAVSVSESGTSATFTVVLETEPAGDVVLDVSSLDTGEATVSPSQLTFTSANWSTLQTVTVTGVNDAVDDGDQQTTISVAMNAAATLDSAYDSIDPDDVTATTTDNDTAGVTRTPAAVTVAESGITATFTVVLASEPAGEVAIDAASSDTGEATVAPAQLTFTAANWSSPQTVTVTGVDDALDDGSQISTIVLTVNAALTTDAVYDAIDPADVTATTTDDDKTPSTTTLTSSVNPSTSGESVTFTAAVTPGATGTVTFHNGAAALGTVSLSSGSASLAIANLATGSHSITATYNGDANFASSTSNTVIQTVNASSFGAPPFFTATATTATSVALSWGAVSGATSYEIHRTSTLSTPYTLVHTTSATAYTNTGLTANTTYLYKVRAIGGSGPSPFSAVDIATTVIFTDPAPTTATKIKAIHITQLRTAVNSVRTAAGLSAATFTDPTLTPFSTKLKAAHITELRTALNAARSTLALSAITYTDPTLTAGSTKAKLVHLTQLRTGVQ